MERGFKWGTPVHPQLAKISPSLEFLLFIFMLFVPLLIDVLIGYVGSWLYVVSLQILKSNVLFARTPVKFNSYTLKPQNLEFMTFDAILT